MRTRKRTVVRRAGEREGTGEAGELPPEVR
jgi:hypothetical protein